jgi:hypothetical protein
MLLHKLQIKILTLNKLMVSSENWQVKPCYFPPTDFSSQATHPKLKIASAKSAQTIHEHVGNNLNKNCNLIEN